MLINDTGAHRMIKSNDENISTSKETDIANSLRCCISENLSSCYSFVDLLDNFTSDGTIYITMNMVLISVVQLTHLKNNAIIGYNNPTVHCGYCGGLQFVHCHNLTIEGIKWNGCGAKSNANTTQGIGLYVHNSSIFNIALFRIHLVNQLYYQKYWEMCISIIASLNTTTIIIIMVQPYTTHQIIMPSLCL